MAIYRVRRTSTDGDETVRGYQLFDRSDQLMLVADRVTLRQPTGDAFQVRFSQPGDLRVASMDLPRLADRRPDKKQNYAIIYEHAVYAMITTMDLSSGTGPLFPRPPVTNKFDRLVIEAEGHRWLGLRPASDSEGPLLTLYDAAASDLPATIDPESADLPEPIGFIERRTDDYHFDLALPVGRLAQAALLGLALVYLIDGQA